MLYDEIRQRVLLSIADWQSSSDDDGSSNSVEARKKFRYFNAYLTCGQSRIGKQGKTYWKKCRSIFCPRCNRKWGSRQASKLLACHPDGKKSDYRAITFMIGCTKNVEEIYPTFRTWRERFKQDIFNRRRRVGAKASLWRGLALCSTLEIDMFREDQFHSLGERKRKQLENKLGYKKADTNDNVYVIHCHAIAHIGGRFEESDLADFAGKHSRDYHIRQLYKHRTLKASAYRNMRYSAKVPFGRELADGTLMYYDKGQIKELMSVAWRTNRQSYMCFIGSVGSRKRKKKKEDRQKDKCCLKRDVSPETCSVQKRVLYIGRDDEERNTHSMRSIYEERYGRYLDKTKNTFDGMHL